MMNEYKYNCSGCGESTARRVPMSGDIQCASCQEADRRAWARDTGAGSAMTQVSQAIARGDLPKASSLQCVDCGAVAEVYDHRDYAKPLEVYPVCVSCNRLRGPAVNVMRKEPSARAVHGSDKPAARRKAAERQRRAEQGLEEVRGIWLPPSKHKALKDYVRMARQFMEAS